MDNPQYAVRSSLTLSERDELEDILKEAGVPMLIPDGRHMRQLSLRQRVRLAARAWALIALLITNPDEG